MCKKVVETAHPAKFSPEDADSERRVILQKRNVGKTLLTQNGYDY